MVTGDSLSTVLFGKARRAVLGLMFGHPGESFYLRQIVRLTAIGLGPAQRELAQLVRGGIVRREKRGHQAYFCANPDSPVYQELRGLLVKTAGVADVLRTSLTELAERIQVTFIYGSVARRTEDRQSDIDIMVIGQVPFGDVVDRLAQAQTTLGREINPVVFAPDEFRQKLSAGSSFVQSALAGEKVFVIGDERQLRELAQ